MTRFSLTKKVVLLVAIPFLAFIVFSLLFINNNFNELSLSKKTRDLIRFVESTSQLVTQLQRERGKSSMFIKGALSLEDMEAQRKETNLRIDPFKRLVPTLNLDPEKKEKALEPLVLLEDLRKAVTQKIAFEESFARYTEVVSRLMVIENSFLKEESSRGVGRRLITVSLLEEAKESAARLRGFASGLIAGNQPLSDEELLKVTALKAGVDINLQSPALMLSPDLREKLKGFKASSEWQEGNKFLQTLIKNADKGQFGIDAAFFFKTMSKQIDDIDQLVALSAGSIRQLIQEIAVEAKQSIILIALAVVIIFAFMAFFSFFLIRSITRPISLVVTGLTEAAKKLSETSDQVFRSSQSLAEGASEQASGLEETSASMEEMASMTKHNADNAVQANTMMNDTGLVVGEADKAMEELTASMMEISTASQETGKIIRTIDEIAFQTNLLALNAAVEAARAGEAGAGFAVVADEVRNLALRAAQAAKNTAQMIEDTVKTIHKGSDIVTRTNKAFSEMASGSKKAEELVKDIASASHEQAQGIDQVTKAIYEMDRVVQQNAASAEESASSAEEMNAQAKQMRGFVDQMNLIMRGTTNGHRSDPRQAEGPRLKNPSRPKPLGSSPKAARTIPSNKKGKSREISPEEVISLEEGDFKEF